MSAEWSRLIAESIPDVFDERLTLLLRMDGRRVCEVSSGSIMKGQSEEALFRYLLPDFLRLLGKSFPHRADPANAAADLLKAAFDGDAA